MDVMNDIDMETWVDATLDLLKPGKEIPRQCNGCCT